MKTITFLTPTLTPGRPRAFVRLWPLLALTLLFPDRSLHAAEAKVLTGKAALGDWTSDAPGVRRRLTLNDLPAPNPAESASNKPNLVKRPEGAWPKAPDGFKVEEFARDLKNPRVIVRGTERQSLRRREQSRPGARAARCGRRRQAGAERGLRR